jgi:catalytic LigB subunit of aromatic ring-opening dioxygenase
VAEIVLGIGTSHSPQVSTPWSHWPNMRKTDEASPAIPGDLEAQLEPQTLERRFALVQDAVATLSRVLQETAGLDAIIIFGDDQHEQFGDGNMPAIAVYHGEICDVHEPRRATIPWTGPADQRHQISSLMEPTQSAYPGAAAFAQHIVESLTEQDFDIARCDRLNEKGLGHAFSFLYQRLWPACTVPIVPIMLNTYYPPNQPTPRRSYALGRAVREAVASWGGGKRVAVIASGGLSHIVVDEPLDRQILEGLQDRDPDKLTAIPREKLRGGTSEILNWVALGGAVAPMEMKLLDYIPGYRSHPSTGCGMAFAQWTL